MAEDYASAPDLHLPPQGEERHDGVLVNTAWVAPSDGLAYWSAASSELYGPLALRRQDKHPFVGQILGHSLGPLSIYRTDAAPIAASRTAKVVRAADHDGFSLLLHLYGSGRITASDRRALLQPGDLLLVDNQAPCVLDCEGDEPWGNLNLTIPWSLAHPYADRLRKMAGVRMSGASGIGGLVRRFLIDLDETLAHDQIGSDDTRLAESALDLVLALCLRLEPNEDGGAGQSHEQLLHQVKTYIEQRLGDPDLRPSTIAQAHFISLRLLYKLFEREGLSVGSWIRVRRFERCRQDLVDPALGDESIAQIAYRWGFTSPAHFSRFFRAMAGISPREFRHEVLMHQQGGWRSSGLN